MTTTNQGMSFAKIEQIVAQRVANAIKAIAIYEEKTRMDCDLMNQVKRQEDKVEENASNKRKWEGDHVSPHWPVYGKYGNCKRVGHQTRDCKTPVSRAKRRPSVAKQKAEGTCYECGELGHYKSDCPKWKSQNHVNKYWKGKARGNSSVVANNVNV
ncbi:reverse transcriptase domain-containing protein [Tanacetum coccineum]